MSQIKKNVKSVSEEFKWDEKKLVDMILYKYIYLND